MNRELKRTKEWVQRLIVLSNNSFYSNMSESVKAGGRNEYSSSSYNSVLQNVA